MKIAVLLSGGVDSSVALELLRREKGHQLCAFYLKVWLEDELHFLGDCPWEEDLGYVRQVCQQADVPLEVVSLQSQYYERIVEYALAELRAGRTPSPDIFCNQRIKFGAFFDHIDTSFDKVASGHYARIHRQGDTWLLQRAPDPVKDQTYFLSNLSQRQLGRALFPIGTYSKPQVRSLANSFALPNRARKDSQGICFLGKINYRDFIAFHLGTRPGAIVEQETATVLGQHQGYWFYTIGQRHGLGLGGGPWYVVGKDIDTNAVYVAHRQAQRQRSQFSVGGLNWIGPPPSTSRLQIKLRHGPQMLGAAIRPLTEDRMAVELDRPDPGIAPGQHAVFYHGEICLGGGIIE